jgi:hypothetical protein
MDVGTLKFKMRYCLECAAEASRDDLRANWLAAAESWRLAIEFRARLQQLPAEWASLKSVAAGQGRSAVESPLPRRASGAVPLDHG